MTHMQKPPPPGQGFLYGEASSQPVFAGANTLNDTNLNNGFYYSNYSRQQGQLVSGLVLFGVFLFLNLWQYTTEYLFWQISRIGTLTIVAHVNNLELVIISRPFYLPTIM